MSLAKQELRESLKAARLALSREERQQKSQAILDRLKDAVDWTPVNTIHCFEPIESLGEVNLQMFLDANKKITYTSRKSGNQWEIVSLEEGKPVPDQFDVIIVPMLGFDKTLNRIGYGGGYYDKFLASQSNAQKIGVCFERGRIEHIPTEPHDIPLNIIITEDNIYTLAYT